MSRIHCIALCSEYIGYDFFDKSLLKLIRCNDIVCVLRSTSYLFHRSLIGGLPNKYMHTASTLFHHLSVVFSYNVFLYSCIILLYYKRIGHSFCTLMEIIDSIDLSSLVQSVLCTVSLFTVYLFQCVYILSISVILIYKNEIIEKMCATITILYFL